MTDGGAVAVNTNGAAAIVCCSGSFTTSNSVSSTFVAPSQTQGSAGNDDGLGNFNITVGNGGDTFKSAENYRDV